MIPPIETSMRPTTLVAALAVLSLAGCKVEVQDKGKLPDVDVKEHPDGTREIDVKPGRLPEVDVKTDSAALPPVKVPDVRLPSVGAGDSTRRDTAPRP
jgi:hypothetical protein